MAQHGIIIDVGFKSDVQGYIDQIEKDFKKVDFSDAIGISKAFENQINDVTDKIHDLKKEVDKIGEGFIDTNAQTQLKDVTKSVKVLQDAFKVLVQSMPKNKQSELTGQLSAINQELLDVAKSTQNATNIIKGLNGVQFVDKSQTRNIEKLYHDIERARQAAEQFQQVRKKVGNTPYDNADEVMNDLKAQMKMYGELDAAQSKLINSKKKDKDIALTINTEKLATSITTAIQLINSLRTVAGSDPLSNFKFSAFENVEQLNTRLKAELQKVVQTIADQKAKLQAQYAEIGGEGLLSDMFKKSEAKEKPVQIALDISPKAKEKLYKQCIQLINKISNELADQPIKIEVQLVSAYQSKKNASLIKELQQNVIKLEQEARDQIASGMSETEASKFTQVSKDLSSLIARMNKQIDNAMIFTVEVQTEKAISTINSFVKEVNSKLEEIVNGKPPKIKPELFLTQKEKTKFLKEVNSFIKEANTQINKIEIQKGKLNENIFSSYVKQLTDAVKSLQDLKKTFGDKSIVKEVTEGNLTSSTQKVQEYKDNVVKNVAAIQLELINAFDPKNNNLGLWANTLLATLRTALAQIQEIGKYKIFQVDGTETKEATTEMVKTAEESTADAQESHSPSKVAEKLGEYWGEGYAKGILKTKPQVQNAIRALVDVGKLTMLDLTKDTVHTKESKNVYDNIINKVPATKQAKAFKQVIDYRDLFNATGAQIPQVEPFRKNVLETNKKNLEELRKGAIDAKTAFDELLKAYGGKLSNGDIKPYRRYWSEEFTTPVGISAARADNIDESSSNPMLGIRRIDPNVIQNVVRMRKEVDALLNQLQTGKSIGEYTEEEIIKIDDEFTRLTQRLNTFKVNALFADNTLEEQPFKEINKWLDSWAKLTIEKEQATKNEQNEVQAKQEVVKATEQQIEKEKELVQTEKQIEAIFYRTYHNKHGKSGNNGISWYGDNPIEVGSYLLEKSSGTDDDKNIKMVKSLIDTKDFLRIDANGSDWNEVMYQGVARTTDEIAKMAKAAGYAGVIFENLQDSINGMHSTKMSTLALFDESKIKSAVDYTKEGFQRYNDFYDKVYTYRMDDIISLPSGEKSVEFYSKLDEILEQCRIDYISIEEAQKRIDNLLLNYSNLLNKIKPQVEEIDDNPPFFNKSSDLSTINEKELNKIEKALKAYEKAENSRHPLLTETIHSGQDGFEDFKPKYFEISKKLRTQLEQGLITEEEIEDIYETKFQKAFINLNKILKNSIDPDSFDQVIKDLTIAFDTIEERSKFLYDALQKNLDISSILRNKASKKDLDYFTDQLSYYDIYKNGQYKNTPIDFQYDINELLGRINAEDHLGLEQQDWQTYLTKAQEYFQYVNRASEELNGYPIQYSKEQEQIINKINTEELNLEDLLQLWKQLNIQAEKAILLSEDKIVSKMAIGNLTGVDLYKINNMENGIREKFNTILHSHADGLGTFSPEDIDLVIQNWEQGVRKLLLAVDGKLQKLDFSKFTKESVVKFQEEFSHAFATSMSEAIASKKNPFTDNDLFSKLKANALNPLLKKYNISLISQQIEPQQVQNKENNIIEEKKNRINELNKALHDYGAAMREFDRQAGGDSNKYHQLQDEYTQQHHINPSLIHEEIKQLQSEIQTLKQEEQQANATAKAQEELANTRKKATSNLPFEDIIKQYYTPSNQPADWDINQLGIQDNQQVAKAKEVQQAKEATVEKTKEEIQATQENIKVQEQVIDVYGKAEQAIKDFYVSTGLHNDKTASRLAHSEVEYIKANELRDEWDNKVYKNSLALASPKSFNSNSLKYIDTVYNAFKDLGYVIEQTKDKTWQLTNKEDITGTIVNLDKIKQKLLEFQNGVPDFLKQFSGQDVLSDLMKSFEQLYNSIALGTKEPKEAITEMMQLIKDLTPTIDEIKPENDRVAKALGQYFGEDYAEGILKGKGKVQDAIRALYNTGKITELGLSSSVLKEADDAYQSIINKEKSNKNITAYQNIIKEFDEYKRQVQTLRMPKEEPFRTSVLTTHLGNLVDIRSGALDAAKALGILSQKYKEVIQDMQKKAVATQPSLSFEEILKKYFVPSKSDWDINQLGLIKSQTEVQTETQKTAQVAKNANEQIAKSEEKPISKTQQLINQFNELSILLANAFAQQDLPLIEKYINDMRELNIQMGRAHVKGSVSRHNQLDNFQSVLDKLKIQAQPMTFEDILKKYYAPSDKDKSSYWNLKQLGLNEESKAQSKVAGVLGQYWGTEFANGILKSKKDVKNAIRALLAEKVISIDDVKNDSAYANILSDAIIKQHTEEKKPSKDVKPYQNVVKEISAYREAVKSVQIPKESGDFRDSVLAVHSENLKNIRTGAVDAKTAIEQLQAVYNANIGQVNKQKEAIKDAKTEQESSVQTDKKKATTATQTQATATQANEKIAKSEEKAISKTQQMIEQFESLNILIQDAFANKNLALMEKYFAEMTILSEQMNKSHIKGADARKGILTGHQAFIEQVKATTEATKKQETSKQKTTQAKQTTETKQVEKVATAIEKKTDAFQQEKAIVTEAVDAEVAKLKELEDAVKKVSEAVRDKNSAFKSEKTSVNGAVNAEIKNINKIDKEAQKEAAKQQEEKQLKNATNYLTKNYEKIQTNFTNELQKNNRTLVNATFEPVKSGLIEITALIKEADDTYKTFIYTTKNGKNFKIQNTKQGYVIDKQGAQYEKYLEQQEKAKNAKPNIGHVEPNTPEMEKVIALAKKFKIEWEDIDRVIRNVDHGIESFQFYKKNGDRTTLGVNSEQVLWEREYIVQITDDIENFKKEISGLPKIIKDGVSNYDANAGIKYSDSLQKIATLWQKIRDYQQMGSISDSDFKIYDEMFSKSAQSVQDRLTALLPTNNRMPEVIQQVDALKTEFQALFNEVYQGGYSIEDAESKFTNLITRAKELYQNIGLDTSKLAKSASIDKLLANIGDELNKNTKMSFNFREQLNGLVAQIQAMGYAIPNDKFKEFNAQFQSIRSQIHLAGQTGKSFFDQMGSSLGRSVIQFANMYLSLYRLISYIRKGITEVTNLDKALTTISYTMNITDKQLKQMGDDIVQMSKDLSISVENVSKIYQIYANMNTSAEEMMKTARPTAILANLSGVDASTAADQIQGVLNQFELLADESQHIVDVYDYISSNISVDYSKGIAGMSDAVKNVGNVAAEAGLSFEQLSAIIAKVMERTRQDGSSIGNALRTILVRVSKATKLAGDEVDNDTLSKASKALHDVGVEVYTAQGEFREFDVIMTELAEKWDSLSDAQQANISFQIAATRQTATLKAILAQWTDSMDLATDAVNANGNALANQDKWEDSIAGKTQELKNEFSQFWIEAVNSDLIKDSLDELTKFVGELNKANSVASGLVSIFGNLLNLLLKIANALPSGSALGAILGLTKGRNLFASVNTAGGINMLGGVSFANKLISANDLQLFKDYAKILNSNVMPATNEAIMTSEAWAKTMATASTQAQQMALKAAASGKTVTATIQSMETSLKRSAVAARVFNVALSMGMMVVISDVIKGINALIHAEENFAEKTKEAGEAYKQASTDINSYKKRIEALQATINDENSSVEDVVQAKEDLYDIQDQLIEQFKDVAGGVDSITAAINGEIGALDRLKQQNWEKTLAEYNNNHSNASSPLDQRFMPFIESVMDLFGISSDELANWESPFGGKPFYNYYNPAEEAVMKWLKGDNSVSYIAQPYFENEILAKQYSDMYTGLQALNQEYSAAVRSAEGLTDEKMQEFADRYEELVSQVSELGQEKVAEIFTVLAQNVKTNADRIAHNAKIKKELEDGVSEIYTTLISGVFTKDGVVVSMDDIEDAGWIDQNIIENFGIKATDDLTILKNAIDECGKDGVYTFENLKNKYNELWNDFNKPRKKISLSDWFEGYSDVSNGKDGTYKNNELIDAYKSSLSSLTEFIQNDEQGKIEIDLGEIIRLTSSDDLLKQLHTSEIVDAEGNVVKTVTKGFDEYIEQYSQRQLKEVKQKDNLDDIKKQLDKYSEGGNVDLNNRPAIDSTILHDKGYDIPAGDTATVFTHTISNVAGDVAINFTPIMVDPETGEYLGVLNPEEFDAYCTGVIAGAEDRLNLQIGAKFEGENAIEEAVKAAEDIHEMHEDLLNPFEYVYGDTEDSNLMALFAYIRDAEDTLLRTIIDPNDKDAVQNKNLLLQELENIKIEALGASNNVDKLQNSYQELKHVAEEELANGQTLSYDRMTELINKYPELKDAVVKYSNDSYKIQKETLDDLIGDYAGFSNEAVANLKKVYEAMIQVEWVRMGLSRSTEETIAMYDEAVENGTIGDLASHKGFGERTGDVIKWIQFLKELYGYEWHPEGDGGPLDKTSKDAQYDWLDSYLEKRNRKLQREQTAYENLGKTIAQTATIENEYYQNANASLEEQNRLLDEQIAAYEEADKQYLSRMKSGVLWNELVDAFGKDEASSIRKRIENQEDINLELYTSAQQSAISALADNWQKHLDAEDKVTEAKMQKQENRLKIFTNNIEKITKQYDRVIEEFGNRQTELEHYQTMRTNAGMMENQKYYIALLDNKSRELQANIDKREELIQKLNEFDVQNKDDLDQWEETTKQINETTKAIYENEESIVSLQASMRQLSWDLNDKIREITGNLRNETEFLIDTLGTFEKDMYSYSREYLGNDVEKTKIYNGQMSDEGLATLALRRINMQSFEEELDELNRQIAEEEQRYLQDTANTTVLDRLTTLKDARNDIIQSYNDEREAIVDLVKDGYDKQLESLQAITDKYMEAAQAEKDLYDYQKSLKKQTKEISNLRKQMQAYAGDTSEEARAKLQTLTVQLEEAEESLADMQYERQLSDQQKIFDNLYQALEDYFNDKLEEPENIIAETKGLVNDNLPNIKKTLNDTMTYYNSDLSQTLNNILSNNTLDAQTINSNIAIVDGDIKAINGSVVESTAELERFYAKYQLDEASEQELKRRIQTLFAEEGKTGSFATYFKEFSDKLDTINQTIAGIDVKNNVEAVMEDTSHSLFSGANSLLSNVSTTKKQSQWDPLGLNSLYEKYKQGNTILNKLGFAKGSKRINSNMSAWTQENGLEAILRPTDNAILTPLKAGDSVLTAEATQNLWNFANNPLAFMKSTVGTPTMVSKGNGVTFNNAMSPTIVLNGVSNVSEFLRELQKNKQFESMMQDMTINLMNGGSSLAKLKYKY